MLPKPDSCSGCPLWEKGTGYAPASGPVDSKLVIFGEALGRAEALEGKPFVGPAGHLLDRSLRELGIKREDVRVDNCIRCQPPKDWLVGAPWERSAIYHCTRNWKGTLGEGHSVVLLLGATAARVIGGVEPKEYSADYWHGTHTMEGDRAFVYTYHPAYLLHGNMKLAQVFLHDLSVARSFMETGAPPYETYARCLIDPSPELFGGWVDGYMGVSGNRDVWLAVDIETPRSSADEEDWDGSLASITRINFSYRTDEGVTVPWTPPYIPYIQTLLQGNGVKILWNRRFDMTHLEAAGVPVRSPALDAMDMWHVLQSDLPRSLGFVAPMYSSYGAWKHLSSSKPGLYAALDAVQTLRVAQGVARDLQDEGRWDVYYRYCHMLDEIVLNPAERVGLGIDVVALEEFGKELEQKYTAKLDDIRAKVPRSVLNTKVWKKKPKVIPAGAEQREIKDTTKVCLSCSAIDVSVKHRCKDKTKTPNVSKAEVMVKRWVLEEEFNPSSSDQILAYMSHIGVKGGKGGKKKKTSKPSTDKKTLEKLVRVDPIFGDILDYRAVDKIKGTYVDGTRARLRDGRVHPSFLHKPSTMRLSCVNPNLQNVVADKNGEDSFAAGFRRCVVAAPGKLLVEVDYSGIEAVLVGWFMKDPDYIRLAKIGVHAFLTASLVGKPADLSWDDETLRAYLKKIKAAHPLEYDMSKRCVHGSNYGMSPFGMHANYPDTFKSVNAATKVQQGYFDLCPKIHGWHRELRDTAAASGYIGGDNHPFKFKHYFWEVSRTDINGRLIWGDDAKRCVAFPAQSAAFGVLAEACLRMMDRGDGDYLGDMDEGRTPIRALIHDSVLFEAPEAVVPALVAKATRIMESPVPQLDGLVINVETKVGNSWDKMEKYLDNPGGGP